MSIVRVGYGKDLDHYQTKRFDSENFDVSVTMDNGDVLEINARKHGYALRQTNIKQENKKTLIDKDY